MKKTFLLFTLPFLFVGCGKITNVSSENTQQTRPTSQVTQQTQQTSQATQQTQADILTLPSGATLKIPPKWEVTPTESNPQFTDYTIKGDFEPTDLIFMTEIHVNEWLKGPNPDEGYVITHDKRPKALQIIKDVYDHKEITDKDRQQFESMAGEFLGYTPNRAALSYIESNDGKYRGLSFYNLRGQDVGASPVYYVVLHNPDQDSIIYATSSSPSYKDNKEVIDINAEIRKPGANHSPETLERLDKKAHEEMKKLLETTARKDLSFGANIDAIDNFMKSVEGI